MIHVVAIITAKPGQREQVLQAFRANVPAVRAEEACLRYEPAADTPDMGPIQTQLGPDSFAVLVSWASREALMAHARAPHMARYAAQVKDMLASRTVHVLSPL